MNIEEERNWKETLAAYLNEQSQNLPVFLFIYSLINVALIIPNCRVFTDE